MRDFHGFTVDKYLFVQLSTGLYLAYDSEQKLFKANLTYPEELKWILGSCTVVTNQLKTGQKSDQFSLVQLGGYKLMLKQNPSDCQCNL